MLLQYFRVFRRNGSTFTDLSLDNQDDAVDLTVDLTATEYLYLSSLYPFNNFFPWNKTANTATAARMSLQYWDGIDWRNMAEILDGSKAFTKSDSVQYTPDRLYTWARVYDTSETNAPPELIASGLKIYNNFWLRLKFDIALTGTPKLKKIGYAFTMSQQLKKHDADVDTYMPGFADSQPGKADWISEIMSASEDLVSDLKSEGMIVNSGQILLLDDVALPCEYKTLEKIYFSLGSSRDEKRRSVRASYEKTLNKRYLSLDQNNDGRLEETEQAMATRTMER